MKNIPNFLVVGAAKAGTTSLYKYLSQHPEIFVPKIKEPCFFSFAGEKINFFNETPSFITNWEDYLRLFEGSESYKVRGELSTPYLYFYKKTIQNIKKYIPNYQTLKIIIILRNPIDRAFSQYMHNVRDMRESLSFEEAIELERKRMKKNYHFDFYYIDRGFYYKQVKAYLENFNNVKIFLFEDLKQNLPSVLEEVFKFLGVNTSYVNKINISKKFNISGRPKLNWINRIAFSQSFPLKQIKKLLPYHVKDFMRELIYRYNLEKEEMKYETRKYLVSVYEEDIRKLSILIDRDLSKWLEMK